MSADVKLAVLVGGVLVLSFVAGLRVGETRGIEWARRRSSEITVRILGR